MYAPSTSRVCANLHFMECPMLDQANGPLCVWVVEDTDKIRELLVLAINTAADLHCPQGFADFETLRKAFKQAVVAHPPDVILLDIQLPGRSGLVALSWLRQRLAEVPIVMLTIFKDQQRIFTALRAGASGYLLKAMPLEDVLMGIRRAYLGEMLLPAPVATTIRQLFQPAPALEAFGLTDRQIEVLECLRLGYSQKQIATALFISTHTVRRHQTAIYRKLGVHSAGEAVAVAFPGIE